MLRFCAQCGERELTLHDLKVRHFVAHELVHELVHVDGKVGRTLKLLIAKPGYLAAEYLRGRRVPYINPIRFYLLAFILLFAATALLPTDDTSLHHRAQEVDPTGWIAGLMSARPQIDWDSARTREHLAARDHWLAESGTMLIFLAVAALQSALFRRAHRRYLEHAVLALNVCTFLVLFVVMGECAFAALHRWMPSAKLPDAAEEVLTSALMSVYWYLSIRRFYGVGRWRAAASTAAVVIVQIGVAIALNIGVLALLVLTAS